MQVIVQKKKKKVNALIGRLLDSCVYVHEIDEKEKRDWFVK